MATTTARKPSTSTSTSTNKATPAKAQPVAKATPAKAQPVAKATPAKAQPVAKATPTKATPTKATPAKATPTKAQPVAKATPTKATPAKATPVAKATPHLDRIGLPGPVKGYTVRWPHASFDLAKKDDKAATGADWLVICNAHGVYTEASNAKEGDVLGSKAGRPSWCAACAEGAS